MDFGLKIKHSFSNIYVIEEWKSLHGKDVIAFSLNNGNEIYLSAEDIKKKFLLNQPAVLVRKEIKDIVIKYINDELQLSDQVKITDFSKVESQSIGGYPLPKYSGEAYLKNIDDYFGDIFFDRIDVISQEKNVVDDIKVLLDISLGSCLLNLEEIETGNIVKFSPSFFVLAKGEPVFSFLLGLKELMVIKDGENMSIESDIGEPIISEDTFKTDVNLSLGKLEMSITQLQDLLVGDFIDIKHLSFPNVDLKVDNKKIAVAELVYNEKKELALEIKEVLIK